MKPYTYLIGWSSLNVWYYGVRYSPSCSPEDLWITYFTSSEYVARFRATNREPDVIQVRRVFDAGQSARMWEERVIRRMKCVRSEKWLNKSNNSHEFNSCSEETRRKISEAHKKRIKPPMSQETKDKIRAYHLSKPPMSDETKNKLRLVNIGKKLSDETRAKISEKTSGMNNPNYGGKYQTEEVKARMRKPKTDSSKMGRWERSEEYRQSLSERQKKNSHFVGDNPMNSKEMRNKVAASKVGRRAHVNTEYPGVMKLIRPGEAPPGWVLKS